MCAVHQSGFSVERVWLSVQWYGRRMKTHIDHLVIVAATLDQGVQWCESVLGITPGPGGEHAQFGTHNRLFKLATPANPLAYGEIIAIDPGAARSAKAGGGKSRSKLAPRWFDMDDPAVRAAVAQGPRLVHFVASTPDIQAARAALRMQLIERGPVVQASRHSRKGVVHWQITVREDGQRLFNGALPTLIQWGKPDATEPLRLHPRNTLPRSGVTLHSLAVSHPSAAKLQAAYEAVGLTGVEVVCGPENLVATLQTPKGRVVLESLGI
jgi:Glyoxalase-like domain